MLNYKNILILIWHCLLLSSLQINAQNDYENFIRINEETRNIELAFKTYENANGTMITLIPMFHIGDAKFYKKASEYLKDMTVLYESVGLSLEDKKKIEERIKSLGGYLSHIYDQPQLSSLFMCPDWQDAWIIAFALVKQQDYLKYHKAKRLIHADIYHDVMRDIEAMDDETLKNKLQQNVPLLGKLMPQTCETIFSYGYYFLQTASSYLGSKEKFLRNAIKTRIDDNNINNNNNNTDEFNERNKIVIQKLELLMSDNKKPENIAIVYGVRHMPVFENFLLENGFKLLASEWIVLTSLTQK